MGDPSYYSHPDPRLFVDGGPPDTDVPSDRQGVSMNGDEDFAHYAGMAVAFVASLLLLAYALFL